MTSSLPWRALTRAGLGLSLACLGLAALHGPLHEWLPGWGSPAPMLVCCFLPTFFQVVKAGYPWRGLAFGGSLALIGLWTLGYRGWQTTARIDRLVRLARLTEGQEWDADLHSPVALVESPAPFAFCYGFWRPRICLSTGLVALLTPEQVRAVLWHEEYHRQHRDPLRLLVAHALCRALFFLPLAWEWHEQFVLRLELAADQCALTHAGKIPLAGALYHLQTTPPPPLLVGTYTAGINLTAARVTWLLDGTLPRASWTTRGILGSSGVVYLLCLLLL